MAWPLVIISYKANERNLSHHSSYKSSFIYFFLVRYRRLLLLVRSLALAACWRSFGPPVRRIFRLGSRQAETSSHQDSPELQGPGIPRREAFPEASWPGSFHSDGVVRAFQVFSSQVATEKPHPSRVSPKFECSSSGTGKCGGKFFGVTAHSRY